MTTQQQDAAILVGFCLLLALLIVFAHSCL